MKEYILFILASVGVYNIGAWVGEMINKFAKTRGQE